MSENQATPSIARNTQVSSTNVLTTSQTHVRMYYQGDLRNSPFIPVYTAGEKAGGQAPFADFVRAQHEFGLRNLDTSTVNSRYMVVTPKAYGANQLRPLHVVTHNTDRHEHNVVYNLVPVDTAVDPELFKTMTTAWRGLFANVGAYTKVSLDTLYLPLLERAFGCALSILIDAPPENTTLDPMEWRDPNTWTGSGGLLRTGPTNQDPLVTATMNTRIPIYLSSNMLVGNVELGLTLLAVAQRAHFYPIPNNGNPFSNYYYENINPITFLSSAPLPTVALTRNNVLRALQQLAQVSDFLGVSDDSFQLAASRCLRAGWVVPDLFTLPEVLDPGAMLTSGDPLLALLQDAPNLLARLRAVVAPDLRPAQAWLRARLEEILAGDTRPLDVFNSCDANVMRILEHLHANRDPYSVVFAAYQAQVRAQDAAALEAIASGGEATPPAPKLKPPQRAVEIIDVWNDSNIRPVFRERFTRPITFFGHTTEEPKYDWSTYLYLSLERRLAVDRLAVPGVPISTSWLPFFNLRFFGAAMLNFACLQNAAINLAPATAASTRGLPPQCIGAALADLDVDHRLYQRSATSGAVFSSALATYHLAYLTHSVVPPPSVARVHALPAQMPIALSEVLITFVDPQLALAVHGVWTPQCPISRPGLNRLYPELRKPTLCYTNFIIDGVADLHTALARGGLSHGMSPQLSVVDSINEEGYANMLTDVDLYSEAYLDMVRHADELVWRYVPNQRFDKFKVPAEKVRIPLSRLVRGATEYATLPEIEFSGTPIMEVTTPPVVAAVSSFGQKIMSALIKCISVVAPQNSAKSANQKEAMLKTHLTDNLEGTDQTGQLELTPELVSLVGQVAAPSPAPIGQAAGAPADFQ